MTSWAIAGQALLSLGFPRQECWSGLPFPSAGDLPDPGVEPMSSALGGGYFTTESPGKSCVLYGPTYLHLNILFIRLCINKNFYLVLLPGSTGQLMKNSSSFHFSKASVIYLYF